MILIFGTAIGILLMKFDFNFVGNSMLESTNVDVGFAELSSIVLTAATVVLGGVALAIGVVEIFGFQFIRAELIKNAEQVVRSRLDDSLDKRVEAEIVKRLVPQIDKMLEKAGRGGQLDKAVSRAMHGSAEDELNPEFHPDDDGNR